MFSAQTARQQKGPRMANFRIPWGDVKNVRNMITQNSKGEKAPSEEAEEFIIHENCLASASAEEGEGGRDKRRLEASFVYFVCRDPPASSSREKRKSTARKERERHIYNSCVPRQRTIGVLLRPVLHFHRESPERGFARHTNIARSPRNECLRGYSNPRCLF